MLAACLDAAVSSATDQTIHRKEGRSAEASNDSIRNIGSLSPYPDGATGFGQHWETRRNE